MDGAAPEREEGERDTEWERATREDFPLLPVVIGIALALLLLAMLKL